jgi:hypothetical protein
MSVTRARLARIESKIRKAEEVWEDPWPRQTKRIEIGALNSFEEAMLEGTKDRFKPMALAYWEQIQESAAKFRIELPKPQEIRDGNIVYAEVCRRHKIGSALDIRRDWWDEAAAALFPKSRRPDFYEVPMSPPKWRKPRFVSSVHRPK